MYISNSFTGVFSNIIIIIIIFFLISNYLFWFDLKAKDTEVLDDTPAHAAPHMDPHCLPTCILYYLSEYFLTFFKLLT